MFFNFTRSCSHCNSNAAEDNVPLFQPGHVWKQNSENMASVQTPVSLSVTERSQNQCRGTAERHALSRRSIQLLRTRKSRHLSLASLLCVFSKLWRREEIKFAILSKIKWMPVIELDEQLYSQNMVWWNLRHNEIIGQNCYDVM